MRTVVVRLADGDLSNQMIAIRGWLDRHRSEPARFVYDQTGDALVISVTFPDAADAEAFATQFDGQEPAQTTPPSEEIPTADLGSLSSL